LKKEVRDEVMKGDELLREEKRMEVSKQNDIKKIIKNEQK
jgi:hypothetical protein